MKYCPECGFLMNYEKKCSCCGFEIGGDISKKNNEIDEATVKSFSNMRTGAINLFESFELAEKYYKDLFDENTCKNILISNLYKIHTSFLSSQEIIDKMNIDNINMVEYCKMKIKDPKSKAYMDEEKAYCEIDNERIVINKKDFLLLDIEKIKKDN